MLHCKRRLMWNISKNMTYTPYFFRRNRDLGTISVWGRDCVSVASAASLSSPELSELSSRPAVVACAGSWMSWSKPELASSASGVGARAGGG